MKVLILIFGLFTIDRMSFAHDLSKEETRPSTNRKFQVYELCSIGDGTRLTFDISNDHPTDLVFVPGLSTQSSFDSISFFWDFGDGNYGKKQNELHRYDKPGVYTIIFGNND